MKQIDEVISKKITYTKSVKKQKEYISENSMEIYGEKGARILSLFCKFKFEKETNQHYQDITVNSKRGRKIAIVAWVRVPRPYQTIKTVKQLNRYVTGTIASEV